MSFSSKGQGFTGFPEEEMSRRFRNILLQFKKTVQTSKNLDDLNGEMEHFLNAARKVSWPHHTSGVYHKDGAEKAMGKVITEFQRYIAALKKNPSEQATHQDLLEALLIVESMLDSIKGR